ncbi:unnamed protein product [Fraxinus pennsylvanica]|uniref:Uncharacterized protein n=1 Tax=Fraxinus pennsylvanica TaxID=56036 RepID=A0AAD1Z4K6_9LAMI|nr:unnamed protein product [Fraxinus pennsylvanica]
MEEKQKTTFFQGTLSFLCSDPLFSTIFTLYILILLYFPAFCHGLICSPVLFFTSIILLYLLRLGASQEAQKEAGSDSTQKLLPQNEEFSDNDLYRVSNESESGPSPNSNPGPNFLADCFVEWNVRAPLEVIHEEYEGEGEGNEGFWEEKKEAQMAIIEKYASLSLYYPASDTDTSSDGDSPTIEDLELSENLWEDDDKEGLIEIELDGKKNNREVDEDNLIEINLFPSR